MTDGESIGLLERAREIFEAMEDARRLLATLREDRCQVVCELYDELGGTGAARALGISRAGVYKLIGAHSREAPGWVSDSR